MTTGLVLMLVFVLGVAALDWVAVAKGWNRVERAAKPLTLVALLSFYLLIGWSETGLGQAPLIAGAVALTFSLAGDVFLLFNQKVFSTRWFALGLGAFLMAHVAYTTALNMPLPEVPSLWSLGLAVLLGITAARVLRRIIDSLRQKGLKRLVMPVAAYGLVITIMLLSALLTLYRQDWETPAAGLAASGAALFFISDVLLAWNQFVKPIRNGRLANMITYHLGQIGLVVGLLLQFAM